jgi:hypothetical protein
VSDNTDLHVWLVTSSNDGREMVVPYVKTGRAMRMGYRIRFTQKGKQGTSSISQQGLVDTQPAQAAALSQLTLVRREGDECELQVALHEGERELGVYRLDCPL